MPSRRSYCYEFPRPAVTVDIVLFSVMADDLKVLLIQRGLEPFKGRWALPGGFVNEDEALVVAARRELKEETSVRVGDLEQFGAFGDPKRDPRGWTISIGFLSMVPAQQLKPVAADDAKSVGWFSVFKPPRMAFDHGMILNRALEHLRLQLHCGTIGRTLLPGTFELSALRRLHEVIFQQKLDRPDFRRTMTGSGLVREVPDRTNPARKAYRFVTT